MRIRPGTPIEKVHLSLTAEQKSHVQAVLNAREEEPLRLREVQNRTWSKVREALEAGVPARVLADRVGVSAARIYQMREESLAFTEARGGESDG